MEYKNIISLEKKEVFEKEFNEIISKNLIGDELKEEIKNLVKNMYKNSELNKIILDNLNLFLDKYKENLKELLRTEKYVKILISAELLENSRLAINTSSGFGQEIFEVGINIHPIFSIPFIPGSSIKGAFRRSFWIYRDERLNNKDEADLIELLIFGSLFSNNKVEIKRDIIEKLFKNNIPKKLKENNKIIEKLDRLVGGAIFLDAYPFKVENSSNNYDLELNLENGEKDYIKLEIPENILAMDIINKHYDDEKYFNDDPIKSGEYINPNPIIFLDIREKTPFTFLLLVDKELWYSSEIKASILYSLLLTFEIVGLGAKTTYGYGRFKIKKIWVIK